MTNILRKYSGIILLITAVLFVAITTLAVPYYTEMRGGLWLHSNIIKADSTGDTENRTAGKSFVQMKGDAGLFYNSVGAKSKLNIADSNGNINVGQLWGVPLTINAPSTSTDLVIFLNTSTTINKNALYAQTNSASGGKGVYGFAAEGYGVYGLGSGTGYGGYFRTNSATGTALGVQNNNASGYAFAVRNTADNANVTTITPSGVVNILGGIVMTPSSTNGIDVQTAVADGIGVYSSATHATGRGFYGLGASDGIFAATTGTGYGGIFKATAGATSAIAALGAWRANTGDAFIVRAIDNTSNTFVINNLGEITTGNYKATVISKTYLPTVTVYKDSQNTFTQPVIINNTLKSWQVAEFAGGLKVKRVSVSATNYTLLVTDYYIGVTPAGSTRTVTLPAAATAGDGRIYIIKEEGGESVAGGNIIVDGNGSETIDGATTKTISAAYGSLRIICNGTNWFTY